MFGHISGHRAPAKLPQRETITEGEDIPVISSDSDAHKIQQLELRAPPRSATSRQLWDLGRVRSCVWCGAPHGGWHLEAGVGSTGWDHVGKNLSGWPAHRAARKGWFAAAAAAAAQPRWLLSRGTAPHIHALVPVGPLHPSHP